MTRSTIVFAFAAFIVANMFLFSPAYCQSVQSGSQSYEQAPLMGIDQIVNGDDDVNAVNAEPGFYTICSQSVQGCLTSADLPFDPNVITLTPYGSTKTQMWHYKFVGRSGGSDYNNVINLATGKCLDILVNPMNDGAKLTTSACCQQCTSQWWRKTKNGPFQYDQNLRALPSGKCVEVPTVIYNQSFANQWTGQPLFQKTCKNWQDNIAQFFTFAPIP